MSKYHDKDLAKKLNIKEIPINRGDLVQWVSNEFKAGWHKHDLCEVLKHERNKNKSNLLVYQGHPKISEQIFLVLGYTQVWVKEPWLNIPESEWGIKTWLLLGNKIVFTIYDPYPSTSRIHGHPFPFVKIEKKSKELK